MPSCDVSERSGRAATRHASVVDGLSCVRASRQASHDRRRSCEISHITLGADALKVGRVHDAFVDDGTGGRVELDSESARRPIFSSDDPREQRRERPKRKDGVGQCAHLVALGARRRRGHRELRESERSTGRGRRARRMWWRLPQMLLDQHGRGEATDT